MGNALKKKYLGKGSHLDPPNIYTMVTPLVVYNAYQFEPDWDPEDISEEDRAEPVQARLLMVCLVVVVSYF